MKVNYNITGAERKSLVGAISQELNAPAKYLGMPTAAYEVGDYHIDKVGTVTGPDSHDLIANLQGLHSFVPVTEEYETPLPDNRKTPAFRDLEPADHEELGIGWERCRGRQGESSMLASDVPELEYRTYQAELNDPDYRDRMEFISAENDEDAIRQAYELATGEVVLLELNEMDEDYNLVRPVDLSPETTCLAIEMPLDGFTPEKLDNLAKLVSAKASLLKAVLGVDDLPIQQTADMLRFPWFGGGLDGDTVKAYASLIGMICAAAKAKHRIAVQAKDPENKKYAMRTWLLSLGFIGDAYKTSRRILLRNLSGNSSYAKKVNMPHKP